MVSSSENLLDEVKKSVTRIQNINVQHLPQEKKLGEKLNFNDAVKPANLLIDLYKRLSVKALQDFPDEVLNKIISNADHHYKLFSDVVNFNIEQNAPRDARKNIINKINAAYASAFNLLHPYIAHSLHRSADFQRLDAEARATIQHIQDKASEASQKLTEHEKNAKQALEEIRKVATEEGVTQQAIHFKNESEKWKKLTFIFACILGFFAIVSIFLHKIPCIKPESTYDTIQLAISKVLIFSVMSYLLILSAKNFLSHKHNDIVNKHRQNALMTYKAIVEASGEEGIRDAVLLQAASCIFSSQATGYVNQGGDKDISNQKSVVEIMTKPLAQVLKETSK
ncbi:MAG: hypothetical protein JRJ49_03635 [Deltaproteobacteria bacterium]|nr:hypothetical protein [Deltaproteobacteria bacterium]